jgi:hypothetical protein
MKQNRQWKPKFERLGKSKRSSPSWSVDVSQRPHHSIIQVKDFWDFWDYQKLWTFIESHAHANSSRHELICDIWLFLFVEFCFL